MVCTLAKSQDLEVLRQRLAAKMLAAAEAVGPVGSAALLTEESPVINNVSFLEMISRLRAIAICVRLCKVCLFQSEFCLT